MTSAERSSLRAQAGALFLTCTLLAVAHTWPMASAPHRYSRIDNADYVLNAWAISWVAHQVVADPLHLFDGNIFWPERRTLAYSEAMIVQGLMAAPVRVLGGSPVLAFNVVMLAGFILTAFAFGLLAWRWTGSWPAAFVAASAAGFNSHLFTRMGHLQAMHVEFIAVALFGLDQVFTRARVRDAMMLAVGFALQGLTSVYLLTFTTWAMMFAGSARLLSAGRGRRTRPVVLLALAGLVAVLLLSFYLNAYYQLHVERHFARTSADNTALAGSYTDYLSTVSRLHYGWWSHRFVAVSQSINFPGITVLVLALVGVFAQSGTRDPRVSMCAAIAVGCAAASMVPRLPGYEKIHDLVPLFWAVRVQAHMGQVVLLSLALLAGFGLARLQIAWGPRRGRWAIAAVTVVLINAEALRAPLTFRTFSGIPPVYDALRAEPRAVVVELPMYERHAFSGNAVYMLNSTRHWKPLVNGYSGFLPPSYVRTWTDVQRFPGHDALAAMHRRGITHVVLHEAGFIGSHGQAAFDEVQALGSLQEIAHEGDIHIYRLRH